MTYKISTLVVFVAILVSGGFAMQKKQIPLEGQWKFKVDSLNRGMSEEWFSENHNKSTWMEVDVPGYWERYHGMATYDGVGWFARSIELKDVSQPMSIFFGGVDDDADVWINGIKVGSHSGYSEAFNMPIHQALKVGTNEIVIHVNDNSGPGGIYKPVTIVPTSEITQLLRTKYAAMEAKKSADWVNNAVIYEVYLRSFSREGTLKALEARVPELKNLGVTVVWLMPIHPVGKIDRKGTLGSPYSVQDYYAVNPEFGTLDDFKSLVRTLHQQGMKIIIDLVANHTAWDNPMLKEHPEWYTHDASGKIIPPNPDWTDVADLNYDRAELRDYMITMMKYWVKDIGIDGYRCDVAELVSTDFWEEAGAALESIKPVMMLSEGTIPEHHVHAFDLTYSWNVYDVLEKVIQGSTPATIFHDLLKTESYQYPRGALRMRFNTNHDKNAWDGPAIEKFTPQGAKATAVLIFTYPGVPMIYNGEEVGNEKKLSLFEKVDIDWSKNTEFRLLYEQLSSLRKEHSALIEGSYSPVKNSLEHNVLSFMRIKGKDSVFVAINFSPISRKVKFGSSVFFNTSWNEFFSNNLITISRDDGTVDFAPLSYLMISSPLK